MRLMVMLMIGLVLGLANNAATSNLVGIWVADLARCNFGTSSRPMSLTTMVALDGNRLEVIEVSKGEGGANLADHQYAFMPGAQSVGTDLGSASTTGGLTVL